MSELYLASLLLTSGTCLAFGLHAVTLLTQTRNRQYTDLLLLALLESAYCVVAYQYFRMTESAQALPWGQSICVFTPYITYFFGQLVGELSQAPGGLGRFQRVNLALTSAFASAVLVDMIFGTEFAVQSTLETDLASAHRHRLAFAPGGQLYLAFVSGAFTLYATLLFRACRARRDLWPMAFGALAYFVCTILDFAILIDLRDGFFVQHFGFFALVLSCWRVLSRRFEASLDELRVAVSRLEEQRRRLLLSAPMLQKQRLDGLGTMTAAIAHEINNPIQGIISYAHLLKRAVHNDQRATDYAEKIDQHSERVASIVRDLLRFGRADDADASMANPGEILRATLGLMESAVRSEGITLRVNVSENLPSVRCRPYQLQQVLVNLINNAREALAVRSERSDEKIIHVVVDGENRHGTTWVTFAVRDTGDGIERAVAERIFEPFFTTKHARGGTGLGLAISQGIAEAHGGTLRVASMHRRGTTFTLEIPSGVVAPEITQASA